MFAERGGSAAGRKARAGGIRDRQSKREDAMTRMRSMVGVGKGRVEILLILCHKKDGWKDERNLDPRNED